MKLTLKRILALSLSCLVAAISWSWSDTAAALPTASELFRNAYTNRYTWDAEFPGYSATVLVKSGNVREKGVVLVESDLNVSVFDIEDSDLRDFVKGQVQMETIHRRRLPFETVHGDRQFILEGVDEMGASIVREVGDESNSFYKVKDGTIAQVNRILQGVAVTVDTLETQSTPKGMLVTHFQTEFRDPESGQILEQEDVVDRHEQIGGYYLLTQRSIEQIPEATLSEFAMPDVSLRFDEIQPL
ncbi:MAG: DUF3386 family protein [Cyanobacteria bacterium SID2]|nr:DUF3386 family protein [Cyanobacteria bacterium SID2]MBP0006464.1 DUF3386 family protein [Cyanobacteria bacterium SBC]